MSDNAKPPHVIIRVATAGAPPAIVKLTDDNRNLLPLSGCKLRCGTPPKTRKAKVGGTPGKPQEIDSQPQWTDAPFGNLQALPSDGKAVTTWSNQDKAFTDIAKGLSDQIRQWAGKIA